MTNTSSDPKATPKTAKTRAVSIAIGEPHDGRLPVTVTVVPVEDLDAKGGVFVDFKKGTKPGDGDGAKLGERSASALKQGDDAVAAMVAKEEGAAAHHPLPPAPAAPLAPRAAPEAPSDDPIAETEVTRVMAAVDEDGKAPKAEQEPIVSNQIAQGLSLTVGQAETFRADVGFPGAAEGETWFVRGRFATIGGKDLSSAWLKI